MMSLAGHTAMLGCQEPADGFWLNGGVATACSSQGPATCTTDDTVCATKAGETSTLACSVPARGYSTVGGIATLETASCTAEPLAIVPSSGAGGTGGTLPACLCSGSFAAAPWDAATSKW